VTIQQNKYRLARVLADSFKTDRFFQYFFAPNTVGNFARYMFFVDEISVRLRFGVVLTSGEAVALVGLPTHLFIQISDLGSVTRFLLWLQGRNYSGRWRNVMAEQKVSQIDSNVAYLSAIACPPERRRMGLATDLLRQITTYVRDRHLDLICEVSSIELVGWYLNRGFVLTGKSNLDDNTNVYTLRNGHAD